MSNNNNSVRSKKAANISIESKKSTDEDFEMEASSQEEDLNEVNLKWTHQQSTLRFSARVVEKQEKLLQKKEFPAIISTEPSNPPEEENNESTVSNKKKRNWTLWSSDDKQYFFEGLNEYGKDFDSIQNFISLKLKSKRSSNVTKNKDQVRHFYYRTWNKISKFLNFPEMKKAHQELYGLINYGELRKKQRVLNLKTAVKLSELVQKGSTTIKVRGKTFRIKTPVCRALKKLNRLEENESKLPSKITIELLPENGEAWTTVQNLSYNPRVKLYLSLQRSLASLIKFFEERWKGREIKMKEQLLQTFGKQIPRLRLIPQLKTTKLHPPIFKILEGTSSAKLSLSSYYDSISSKPPIDQNSNANRKQGGRTLESDEAQTEEVGDVFEKEKNENESGPILDEEDFVSKFRGEQIKRGWNYEEAGMLTIGEIYIMMGSLSTLHFEYKWDEAESKSRNTSVLIQKLLQVTNFLKKKKGKEKKGFCPTCSTSSSLSNNKKEPKTILPTLVPKLTVPSEAFVEKRIILLPKGNRRLGRPANNNKKIIIPRILPLKPKVDLAPPPVINESINTSSITPSEFNDLIRIKSGDLNLGEGSTFSLSSFLDLSLPPSSSSDNIGNNSLSHSRPDKFLCSDDNSLLNLLNCTEESSKKCEEALLSNGAWLSSESNDLSLSSLLCNLESNVVGDNVEMLESSSNHSRTDKLESFLRDEVL